MGPRKILIHIGAPKTASTTLQRCLFARHAGIHFFGEDGAGHLCREDAGVAESMLHDDDLYFPKTACGEIFDKHRALAAGKTLLYSNADIMASRVPTACAKRMCDLLPEAEILLIIRNQLTAIPSYYANHGAFLKPAPPRHFRRFVSFDDWMRYCTMFPNYSPLASYNYYEYLRIYAGLFGKNRVHVLLFEDFVGNKKTFIDALSALLEVEAGEALALVEGGHERSRITARALRYHRIRSAFLWQVPLSRLIPGGQALAKPWRNWLNAGPKADAFMSNEWRERIGEMYKRSNSELARNFHAPVGDYGYPIQ